ncbi:SDR family oxidoreductase [Ulvibacterium sp.]|uniref:SDR family oxidoreductase n=1 Tax=Ulvibacterium sp. TaxID=2665914 RepID=UPI00261E319E|nr:SDR family oxidoreductase [Ulvibacterium sp.]
MKVLVTGGNIGLTTANLLANKGVETYLLVRESGQTNLGNIREVVADVSNPNNLEKAFEGMDKFFFVSPLVENMIELAENTVRAAKYAGVSHIIRSSARGASLQAPITMGKLHGRVEQLIVDSGIDYTFIQPASFYQNIMGSLGTIHSENVFYGATGEGTNAFIDVRDIAAVGVEAIIGKGHSNKTYEITGPEVISSYDMARELSQHLGREIKFVNLESGQLGQAYKSYGMSDWLITALLELDEITRKGYLASATDDIEKILGRKPRTFGQFVADNISTFQGN